MNQLANALMSFVASNSTFLIFLGEVKLEGKKIIPCDCVLTKCLTCAVYKMHYWRQQGVFL